MNGLKHQYNRQCKLPSVSVCLSESVCLLVWWWYFDIFFKVKLGNSLQTKLKSFLHEGDNIKTVTQSQCNASWRNSRTKKCIMQMYKPPCKQCATQSELVPHSISYPPHSVWMKAALPAPLQRQSETTHLQWNVYLATIKVKSKVKLDI